MSFIVVGTVTAVAAVGSAYSQYKAGNAQQKQADLQNARERKNTLRGIRMAQRALEFQGAASGTGGSSSQSQAMGSAASSGAGNIGYQQAMISNSQSITHWNNMATGFGALSQVAQSYGTYKKG